MYIKKRLTKQEFMRLLEQEYPAAYSTEAMGMIYDYINEIDNDPNEEESEFDADEILATYEEDSYNNIARNFSIDLTSCKNEEECEEVVIEFLLDDARFIGTTEIGILYLTH